MKQAAAKRAMSPQKAPIRSNPMVYVLIVAILLAFLGAIYGAGVYYFTDRFPNHTTVNGTDVSGCKKERARVVINAATQDYVLTIQERGGESETLSAQQVNMTYEDHGELEELIQSFDPKLWFMDYFRQHELTAATATIYDVKLAEQMVDRLRCFNELYITPMENACVEPVPEGGYHIKPEEPGNELVQEEAKRAIFEALDGKADTVDLEQLDLYVKPTVLSDDAGLISEMEQLNLLTKAKITFDFGDNRIEIVDHTVIGEWVVRDKKGNLSVDKDLVFEWVKKNLAYKYDTFGLTHVVKTHKGKTVTLKGGDYGWCLNRQATADALLAAVEKGEETTLEPIFLYSAKNMGIDDIGGTYVEVSIKDQHMWCYENYKLVVDTPVVTGNPNKEGCETPSGSVWAMDCHKSPAVLGSFVTMGYSSYVNFWMSFTGNVGIHDASWRGTDPSNYGGEIYKTNGSHGCVNTPYDAAKKIYEVCSVGTAVVVY